MNTSIRLRSISVAMNFLLPVCLASLIFCSYPASAAGAAELKAQLVNKIWEGDGLIPFETGQVQLTFPDDRTRLLTYRSHLEPMVADGKVYIFTSKDGILLTGIIVYDAVRGRGHSFPLPKDLKLDSFQPSFSPDGTKVAYYFFDGESKHKPKFGFVDLRGRVVVSPRFDWGRSFR
jgi:hypothetical protein